MKRTLRGIALTLSLLLATSAATGCGYFDNRSYSSVATHVEQRVSEDDPSILRAETYQQLVSAILCFVQEGTEQGTVRLYQYTGDVESDLDAACKEVTEQEPLGVYALEGITHAYSRIVSYYECTFQLSYSHTPEEIAGVSLASSFVSLREQIQQGMERFATSLAFRTSLLTTEEQIRDMVDSYYDRTPQLAFGRPQVEVEYYQGVGADQWVIEVRFTYDQPTSQAQAQKDYVTTTIRQLALGINVDRDSLWLLFSDLTDSRQVEEKGSDSVYDYLYSGSGSQEAAALTTLSLCQQLGLDSQLVRGTDLEGNPQVWVALCLDGHWCHLVPDGENREENFLRSDAEMEEEYLWNRDEVHPCDGYPLEEEPEESTSPGLGEGTE
jgi:hypothetical protein